MTEKVSVSIATADKQSAASHQQGVDISGVPGRDYQPVHDAGVPHRAPGSPRQPQRRLLLPRDQKVGED